MSGAFSMTTLWLGALLAALLVPGDDPRWRLRESAAAYLQHIQEQRELRLAERVKQGQLVAEFAAFAAELCLPEPSAKLRQLAGMVQFNRGFLEQRRIALDRHDTWTTEQPDGSYRQLWTIVEHVHEPRFERGFSGTREWREKELTLVFRGVRRQDGGFDVAPEWIEARRSEERLPPQLARLLDLLSPDAKMLVSSATEAPR